MTENILLLELLLESTHLPVKVIPTGIFYMILRNHLVAGFIISVTEFHSLLLYERSQQVI